jgi:hypothetical protein
MLALAWLVRSGVIDNRAVVAAWLAYVWGVWSMQLCGWFWRRQYWANSLPDDSSMLGELRLKADGDGVECSDQSKSTKYSWRAFSDISEHADGIVLWFDRAQGVVVPARALAGEETRRDFVNLAREHMAPPSPRPAQA